MRLLNQRDSGLLQLVERLVSWWREGGRLLILGSTATVLASVLLGFMAVMLPWWFALMLLVGLVSAILMFVYPILGLSLVVLTAFQGVPGAFLREIPLGVFKLQSYELCLFVTISGALYKLWRDRLVGASGQKGPYFFGVTATVLLIIISSVVYSRWGLSNTELAFAEARSFVAILVLPLLSSVVTDDRRVALIERVIAASGVLVSVYVLIQLLTSYQILSGRMEDLELSKNSGVTRTVVGVSVFVQAYAIYFLALRLVDCKKYRFVFSVLLIVTVMGVLGTYTRGAWISIFAGGLIVAFIRARISGVAMYLIAAMLIVLISLGAIYLFDPLSADAMVNRALGIHGELTGGASYGWRIKENALAYQAIAQNPLLGVGVGGAYKDVLSSAGSFLNEQYMIHNAYYYFPLKMGIPGVVLLCVLIGSYVIGFLNIFRQLRIASIDRVGGLVAGVGTIVAFLIAGVEGQSFNKFGGMLIFCLVLWMTARAAVKREGLS